MGILDEEIQRLASTLGKQVEGMKAEADAIKKARAGVVSADGMDAHVIGVLRARYARENRALANAVRYNVILISKTKPSIATTKKGERRNVARAFAYVKSKEEGASPEYADVTFWENAISIMNTLDLNRPYEADLTPGGGSDGSGLRLTWPEGINPAHKGEKLVPTDKLIAGIPSVKWADAEQQVDSGKPFMVRGFVSTISIGTTTEGRGYAVMNVIPPDQNLMTTEDSIKGGVPCWVDPDMITFGAESEVVVIGNVGRSKKNNQPNFRGRAVVPLVVIPAGKAQENVPEDMRGKEVLTAVKKSEDDFF